MAVIKLDGGFNALPISYKRGNPIPLDTTAVWYDLEALKTYAKEGATAYVGQVLTHVDAEKGEATVYTIKDTNGTLVALGTASATADGLKDLADKVGDLASLTTTAKNTVVAAINELVTNLNALSTKHANEVGVVADLTTTAKTVVGAINELDAQVGTAGDAANAEGSLYARVAKNAADIAVLNGDASLEGSVKHEVATKVAEVVNGADASYDTLKEIADWIKSDTTGAASMASDINTLKTTVGNAESGLVKDVAANATAIAGLETSKVSVETGKRLMTDAEGTKLEGIEAGAEVNVVDAVSAEFTIGENRTLEVATIAASKITGLNEAVTVKADKVTGAVAGNFAGLDANGNLTDSGKKAADFATADQGAKADSALQGVKVNGADLTVTDNKVNVTVATGTENGTLAVNGLDVAVKGLGSAAFTNATAYDEAGAAQSAKEAVVGVSGDAKTADTVFGAKAFATDAVANLEDSLAAVAKSGAAADVSVADEAGKIVATNVEAALAELATNIGTNAAAIGASGDAANAEGSLYARVAQNKADIAALNGEGASSVAGKIKSAIEALDVTDNAVAKEFVTAVSQADGKVVVSRAALTKEDIPVIEESQVNGLTAALVLKATVASVEEVAENLATLDEEVASLEESLADVAFSGTAADVAVVSTKVTAKTVEAAVEELAGAVETAANNATVTVTEGSSADYAKVYTIAQGGTTVGTINIPKDMVVESGSVVTLDAAEGGHEAGTYIKLVLANATNDEVWVPVKDLIEYVTGGATDEITVTVDPATHVATAVLNDGSVAKAKLASAVQTSLGLADTAVQPATLATKVSELQSYADQAEADAILAAVAADQRVKVNALSSAKVNTVDGITVALVPTSGYEVVAGYAKVAVNSAVYYVPVEQGATEASFVTGFALEFTGDDADEVYVEFSEVQA